jgi:hypothetical protein
MANVITITRQIGLVRGAFAAEHLAELARQALVAEAELKQLFHRFLPPCCSQRDF